MNYKTYFIKNKFFDNEIREYLNKDMFNRWRESNADYSDAYFCDVDYYELKNLSGRYHILNQINGFL